jgi:hypothetical protein
MSTVTPADIKNWFAKHLTNYDALALESNLSTGQNISLAKVAFQKEGLEALLSERFKLFRSCMQVLSNTIGQLTFNVRSFCLKF